MMRRQIAIWRSSENFSIANPEGAVSATRIQQPPIAERALVTPSRSRLTLVAVGAAVLTLIIRLALHESAFDVFGDEVIYADIGRSVVSGGFPRFYGEPFFLHGPAFFYLEAGWAHLLGTPAGLVPWIYEMRTLNAVLAAGTAAVLVLLASRAGSLRAGVVAGLIFALDPFCIRQNDRVLLETAMMFWVLAGYLVFSSVLSETEPRRSWVRATGAGLLFGCAVLTKDEAALLTVLPLLALLVARRGARPVLLLLTIGATALPYTCYVVIVAAFGYLPGWWSAKTSGLKRMIGVLQTTGFHSSAGGSLTGRLLAEGGYFAPTYLILALAVPALVLLLRRGGRVARILGLLHCAALLALGYAVVLGTLEEQELYLLVVPSVLTLALATTLRGGPVLAREDRAATQSARWRAAAGATALVAMLGVNVSTAITWLREPDNGFARLLPYLDRHVPAGTAITIAAASRPLSQSDGGRYALEDRYQAGLWWTPHGLRAYQVRYVLVEWGPVREGDSFLRAAEVRRLVRGSKLLFSFTGRSYGQLALYRLPR
jgi:hypothetical protein